MDVPGAVLRSVQVRSTGFGSTVRLSAVTVPEFLDWGVLTGTVTVQADGSQTTDPAGLVVHLPGFFAVSSGPCTVSDGGRCVGRPGGYEINEACAITVGGGGGTLEPCSVFDMDGTSEDYLALPDGSTPNGSECPTGTALAPGDSVGWTSGHDRQGSSGWHDNGCTTKGTCGLLYSEYGLGGGWQICFA